ncbi:MULTISPECIES: alginate lyase family protein [unclassified Streptomyces]|uniref:alginate lyase family protein n=1 Tax=unclassified Streptomyces TaxID=2593676 RepID=UPI0022588624|nr:MULTISPECIES: alginate lyase family protein [unclassified Streptomyces]MCX5330543.1 alginate lyase family protein [Streptomyces sp. NBC_00140]MCX5359938.1 alginate lyase family protein [Streptomyces sp. NBC_00124]
MSRTSPHRRVQDSELSRRGLLRTAGGLGAALALGGGAFAATSADAAPSTWTHPGMLHNAGDINRAKVRVAAGTDPWLSGWNRLVANSHSQSTWTNRATATVIRGGTGENYGLLYNDIAAAYQNALRWRVGGTEANAVCAAGILNAWSTTLTSIGGNADRFLAAGLYGWQFANACELMRDYDGFDLAAAQEMMARVFYPMNNSFLNNHNDACITNYWANWDLCNMASVLAIGILNEDGAKYDQAVTYFKSGAGNGSLAHAVPYLYTDSDGYALGQWQESGRDQGHTVMGMGQMGAICEMAWNQGDDLYSYDSRRFMKGAQYVAKYNLGNDVPFTTYTWGTGQNCSQSSQTAISSASRGQIRPVWAMLHFHYNRRLNLDDKYISAFYYANAPEGGGGDYGSTSGGFDQLGFGTLMYAK